MRIGGTRRRGVEPAWALGGGRGGDLARHVWASCSVAERFVDHDKDQRFSSARGPRSAACLPSGVSEGLGGHRPTSRAENGRLTSIGIGPNGLSGNESEGNRSRYPDIESRRSEARVHQVFGDHLPRLDQNEHSASGPRQAPQGPVRTSPFGVSLRGRGGLHDNLRRRRIGPGGRVGVRQGEAT